MAKESSAIIDGILRLLATSGALSVAILLPGMAQVLEKPTLKFLDRLDERSQERELLRILVYMKKQKLVDSERGYDHGIVITTRGLKRLQSSGLGQLKLVQPKKWDKKWRLVLFDIPERLKKGRDALTRKLKTLGFHQLQRSVWIHPYPCKEEIGIVSTAYDVARYVSYIETDHIDQQHKLVQKFGLK